MTWKQIAQAVTNAIVAMRTTVPGATRVWHEGIRGYGDSELAATQSAITALLYNETLGAVTPAALRDELKATFQGASSVACRNGAGRECGPAETGASLLAMKFAGLDLTNPAMQAAISSLNNNWRL